MGKEVEEDEEALHSAVQRNHENSMN